MTVLESYLKQLPKRQFKKGEMIYLQGSQPSEGYGIVDGIVKVYNLTSSGEQKCISYYVRQDTFPNCWLFSKTDKALYYHEARTDCEVAAIDKERFHIDIKQNPDLMYEVLQHRMGGYVQLMLRVNSLEQPRAAIKLLNVLQLLCLRYGVEVKKDVVRIELPLTQQEIADFTGLTRETTTVKLKRLRQEKVIVPDRKNYVINTALLDVRLDDEFNPGIHLEV